MPRRAHPDLVGDLVVRRLRPADGCGAERHDITSYETHAGRWVSFRQPTFRRFAEIQAGGELPEGTRTFEYNPGEVWEENEFWIDLSWKIDPDGSLGIREWFQSPDDAEKPLTSTSTTARCSRTRSRASPRRLPKPDRDPARVHARTGRRLRCRPIPTSPTSARSSSADALDGHEKDADGVYRSARHAGYLGRRPVDRSPISQARAARRRLARGRDRRRGARRASRPRRRSSSSSPRPSRSGAGPSTPRRSGSRAMCTGKTSTWRATSASCCRPSASRR